MAKYSILRKAYNFRRQIKSVQTFNIQFLNVYIVKLAPILNTDRMIYSSSDKLFLNLQAKKEYPFDQEILKKQLEKKQLT